MWNIAPVITTNVIRNVTTTTITTNVIGGLIAWIATGMCIFGSLYLSYRQQQKQEDFIVDSLKLKNHEEVRQLWYNNKITDNIYWKYRAWNDQLTTVS